MKLRAPSIPLITVDPYFSIWMPADKPTDKNAVHWTGKNNTIEGYVTIDGEKLRFLGDERDFEPIQLVDSDITALTTEFTFKHNDLKFFVTFFTPLLPDDLYRISRPVSYLNIRYESEDNSSHEVKVEIIASEELCLNEGRDKEIDITDFSAGTLKGKRIGSKEQNILHKSGDNIRIDWGYFYLCGPEGSLSKSFENDGLTYIGTEFNLQEEAESTVLFAYDDIKALQYFGENIDAYWKSQTDTIEEAIIEAYNERSEILNKCRLFSEKLYCDAEKAGGYMYAELLSLAYRQVIAAHKLAKDSDGNNIFISKECFSGGLACTVDVTYPSSPMFLLYNTELLKGMLRPIFKYSKIGKWKFDFAPHDIGVYPLVNGQVYGDGENGLRNQMPVEESGNMLILVSNIVFIENSTELFDENEETIRKWVKYLCEYGEDPENQLCTDDFAGHLAHNCNLSLKAIMGIKGFSMILAMKGLSDESTKYAEIAESMAQNWLKRAWNSKGGFRLAFDKDNTFSMKYNMIWDKLWGTNLFPPYALYAETESNFNNFHYYGMPLDNRKNYTKSDWLVWTACLTPTKEDFIDFITPMYEGYNVSLSRVPLTDWYDTDTAQQIEFQHRTVQGGLFIKLLEGKF